MDFFATRGLGVPYSRGLMDPLQPWQRCTGYALADARLNPPKDRETDLSGSRILRHPYLDAIVYPRVPDETVNFSRAPLRRMRTVTAKTLTSSGIARFLDAEADVVIHEIWRASTASTLEEFFHALYQFWTTPLPVGQFIGWMPRDLAPRPYHVHIVDVRVGSDENLPVSEQGRKRPYLMKETLTLSLKIVAEAQAPASIATLGGL